MSRALRPLETLHVPPQRAPPLSPTYRAGGAGRAERADREVAPDEHARANSRDEEETAGAIQPVGETASDGSVELREVDRIEAREPPMRSRAEHHSTWDDAALQPISNVTGDASTHAADPGLTKRTPERREVADKPFWQWPRHEPPPVLPVRTPDLYGAAARGKRRGRGRQRAHTRTAARQAGSSPTSPAASRSQDSTVVLSRRRQRSPLRNLIGSLKPLPRPSYRAIASAVRERALTLHVPSGTLTFADDGGAGNVREDPTDVAFVDADERREYNPNGQRGGSMRGQRRSGTRAAVGAGSPLPKRPSTAKPRLTEYAARDSPTRSRSSVADGDGKLAGAAGWASPDRFGERRIASSLDERLRPHSARPRISGDFRGSGAAAAAVVASGHGHGHRAVRDMPVPRLSADCADSDADSGDGFDIRVPTVILGTPERLNRRPQVVTQPRSRVASSLASRDDAMRSGRATSVELVRSSSGGSASGTSPSSRRSHGTASSSNEAHRSAGALSPPRPSEARRRPHSAKLRRSPAAAEVREGRRPARVAFGSTTRTRQPARPRTASLDSSRQSVQRRNRSSSPQQARSPQHSRSPTPKRGRPLSAGSTARSPSHRAAGTVPFLAGDRQRLRDDDDELTIIRPFGEKPFESSFGRTKRSDADVLLGREPSAVDARTRRPWSAPARRSRSNAPREHLTVPQQMSMAATTVYEVAPGLVDDAVELAGRTYNLEFKIETLLLDQLDLIHKMDSRMLRSARHMPAAFLYEKGLGRLAQRLGAMAVVRIIAVVNARARYRALRVWHNLTLWEREQAELRQRLLKRRRRALRRVGRFAPRLMRRALRRAVHRWHVTAERIKEEARLAAERRFQSTMKLARAQSDARWMAMNMKDRLHERRRQRAARKLQWWFLTPFRNNLRRALEERHLAWWKLARAKDHLEWAINDKYARLVQRRAKRWVWLRFRERAIKAVDNWYYGRLQRFHYNSQRTAASVFAATYRGWALRRLWFASAVTIQRRARGYGVRLQRWRTQFATRLWRVWRRYRARCGARELLRRYIRFQAYAKMRWARYVYLRDRAMAKRQEEARVEMIAAARVERKSRVIYTRVKKVSGVAVVVRALSLPHRDRVEMQVYHPPTCKLDSFVLYESDVDRVVAFRFGAAQFFRYKFTARNLGLVTDMLVSRGKGEHQRFTLARRSRNERGDRTSRKAYRLSGRNGGRLHIVTFFELGESFVIKAYDPLSCDGERRIIVGSRRLRELLGVSEADEEHPLLQRGARQQLRDYLARSLYVCEGCRYDQHRAFHLDGRSVLEIRSEWEKQDAASRLALHWRMIVARRAARVELQRVALTVIRRQMDPYSRSLYYYNVRTGETSWWRPWILGDAEPGVPEGWEEVDDGEGGSYYFHPATGRTAAMSEDAAAARVQLMYRNFRAGKDQIGMADVVRALRFVEATRVLYDKHPYQLATQLNMAMCKLCIDQDVAGARTLLEAIEPVIASNASGLYVTGIFMLSDNKYPRQRWWDRAQMMLKIAKELDRRAESLSTASEAFFRFGVILHASSGHANLLYALYLQCVEGDFWKVRERSARSAPGRAC